jgi:hypothetical protein
MFRKALAFVVLCIAFGPALALAQSITPLTHGAPGGAQLAFLMTDGTVLIQSASNDMSWYKLTPDNTGSYINGTWTQVASLPTGYSPDAFASAVLADGRLLIEGGEYNQGQFAFTNLGAVYDPLKNAWTKLAPPKGWKFIGDSPSSVLPNGDFLIGEKFKKNVAELDPTTMTWTELASAGKNDFNAEEGWTLLPDGSILTYDVKDNPKSERYVPDKGAWLNAGNTVVNLQGPQNCCGNCIVYGKDKCYDPPGEVGPAILMPNGTVFATGATHEGQTTAHTAIYTPKTPGYPSGGWVAGPDFPNEDQAGDDFAALLPNGNALVEGNSGTLYEFNGTTLKAELGGGGSLLVLPTGQVLLGGSAVYASSGSYQQSWAPTITTSPASVTRGSTYQISGTQFNGLSQANSFGDEYQTATNYPLVRITNSGTGHVFYARTHDHSTMGVATGSETVSTNFDVPKTMETGASTLVVVANGIPSTPVSVTVN